MPHLVRHLLYPALVGSSATPSPRGFAPKTPSCHCGLDPESPFLVIARVRRTRGYL